MRPDPARGMSTTRSAAVRSFSRLVRRVSPFRRILLLEDDTSMQRLVAKLLRSPRVRVELFGDGRAVVARIAAKRERYDAVLLDLMMPHEGGLTVLRDLRDHHPTLLRRVILLTGSGSGITDPWSPLVFAVVHKPFEASVLQTTVRACVRQAVSR
jgi:two-component system, OmpR family, response regulator